MDKTVLMVIANQDFQDTEFSVPRSILAEHGIGIRIAAAVPGNCLGIKGTQVTTDTTFDEVNVGDYDAILYVGGVGVESYFTNEQALGLARDFLAAGKLVCAICWAPVILARAGLLESKRVTAWPGAKNDVERAGATYTGNPVTVDGLIVTANGPEAAENFTEVIIGLL
ncbi:MAG: DJ-1/PfpI family protein [Patescibacteria group bacterium]